MIQVVITNGGVKIDGHSATEYCARVSTLFQTMAKLFSDKITDGKVGTGVSYLELDYLKLNKAQKENYKCFVECFIDLSNLYPNTIKLDNKFTEAKSDE